MSLVVVVVVVAAAAAAVVVLATAVAHLMNLNEPNRQGATMDEDGMMARLPPQGTSSTASCFNEQAHRSALLNMQFESRPVTGPMPAGIEKWLETLTEDPLPIIDCEELEIGPSPALPAISTASWFTPRMDETLITTPKEKEMQGSPSTFLQRPSAISSVTNFFGASFGRSTVETNIGAVQQPVPCLLGASQALDGYRSNESHDTQPSQAAWSSTSNPPLGPAVCLTPKPITSEERSAPSCGSTPDSQ